MKKTTSQQQSYQNPFKHNVPTAMSINNANKIHNKKGEKFQFLGTLSPANTSNTTPNLSQQERKYKRNLQIPLRKRIMQKEKEL